MQSIKQAEFTYGKLIIIADVCYYPGTTGQNSDGYEYSNDDDDYSVEVFHVYDEDGEENLTPENMKVFHQLVLDSFVNGNIEFHEDVLSYKIC